MASWLIPYPEALSPTARPNLGSTRCRQGAPPGLFVTKGSTQPRAFRNQAPWPSTHSRELEVE